MREAPEIPHGAEPVPKNRQSVLTWRFWVLPAVLVLLLAALLATASVLLLDRREALPTERAVAPADVRRETMGDSPAEQAVARARLAARTYFTLDHTSVAADMDRLRDLGTPAFVEDYDARAPALRRRVTSQRLQLSATLPRNGVATEYLSQNVAQLLVSVDVTTRRGDASSTGTYRTRVLLQRVDERWLLDAVDEVG